MLLVAYSSGLGLTKPGCGFTANVPLVTLGFALEIPLGTKELRTTLRRHLYAPQARWEDLLGCFTIIIPPM